MTARIIYGTYLDDDLKPTIGGIQTYITNLLKVLQDYGIYDIVIYQPSGKKFDVKL